MERRRQKVTEIERQRKRESKTYRENNRNEKHSKTERIRVGVLLREQGSEENKRRLERKKMIIKQNRKKQLFTQSKTPEKHP